MVQGGVWWMRKEGMGGREKGNVNWKEHNLRYKTKTKY